MWEHLDIWLLLAGLGIFLFGIRLIEDSIEKLGGRGFKRLVREGTSTTMRAIVTGTAATALLQSSSAVTLMVLAFVGADIVSLAGGIGVILGSNIGTTATSWIVATIGFKLDIEQMALPFIGIGGLILIFLGRSPRYSQISHLLVGFGFLFLGLDHMKDSVSAFAEDLDPALLVDASPWMFLVLGIVLTAVMQSSSATVAILLTALYAGVLDLQEGALAIIGSNVGTTVTLFLGALGGTVVKKRLALSHLLFNVFAALLALAALPVYMQVVYKALGEGYDPVIGLALFHTLFNVVGVAAMFPFTARFGRLMERMVPEQASPRTRFIGHTSVAIPEAAVPGVQKEVRLLLALTLAFHLRLLDLDPLLVLPAGDAPTGSREHDELYRELKELQAEIMAFSARVEEQELHGPEALLLNRSMHAARLALYAAKGLKDVKRNLDAFGDSPNGFTARFHSTLRKRMMATHMRISRLLESEAGAESTVEIAALLRHLEMDDAQGMQEVTAAARTGELRSLDLSTALLVNRAVVRSSHDLLLAVAELILPQEELHTLERVREVEEALDERPEGP
jgi:phosphate:Na+ symporter